MTNTETNLFELLKSLIPEEYRQDVHPISKQDYLQQQCDWFNESEGKLTGYDCPECKNRGCYQVVDKDGNCAMRECKCMAARRYICAMIKAGLGEIYKSSTFDSYNAEADWQKRCKAIAMRYAETPGNGWLLFSGQSGTGKTHLCTAVCSELAKQGRDVLYVQWKRLYDKLVQTKFKLHEQEQMLSEITHADVLYLDDFLKTANNVPPTSDMISYALEIIDARDKADRKTILSTEFFSDEIIRFDEALGGRIVEKTEGNKIQVLRAEGRNYRMRRKQ